MKKIIEEVLGEIRGSSSWKQIKFCYVGSKVKRDKGFEHINPKYSGWLKEITKVINKVLKGALTNLAEKKDGEFEKSIDEFYNEFVLYCFYKKDWNLFIKLWNKYLGKYCTCNQRTKIKREEKWQTKKKQN